MKKKLTVFLVLLILLFASVAVLVIFFDLGTEGKKSSAPVLNNGRKWKIAYLQSGENSHNTQILKALVDGLAQRGWLKPLNCDGLGKDAETRECWNYICEKMNSDYLTFASSAYWSSGWEVSKRNNNRKEILARLNGAKDIDLLIAQGLWSGQDLATNLHKVPVLVISSLNPQTAGIRRDDEQGLPHIFFKYDPEIIIRQIRMFHLLAGFKKLGVVYELSENGKLFSNIEALKSVAREKDFELIIKAVAPGRRPQAESAKVLLKAYTELAKETDAIWITTMMEPRNLPEIMNSINKNKVPTWSPYSERFIESGGLFSVKTFPAENAADYADVIAMIFNGRHPLDINPFMNTRYELIINHATAKMLEYKIPHGLLQASNNRLNPKE